MDFELPTDLVEYLAELDEFIEREIVPLEQADDNLRFFDHRREDSRTDWDRGGLPNGEWEALLGEARRRADAAGHFRYPFPAEFGGRDGSNLGMAVIREHLARRGLGLHCDLQNEHAIVGNNVGLLLMLEYGSAEQKAQWVEGLASGTKFFAFGITEPEHGSDATHMETRAVRHGDGWIINGEKTWNTGVHIADADLIFARTSGEPGDGRGITAFLVPADAPGFKVEEYLWTFNMPTDHAHISLTDVRVPDSAIFGGEGRGLGVVQHFFNENRIRQAASSLGAAQFCIDRSVAYAKERKPFGKPLASNQAIQFPLVELQTQCEMLRALIHKTAWSMDTYGPFSVSEQVSMCNYIANRLCCDAADRAMQVHGGLGYSRHMPFEHIYRHHRRYRITEGAEEIQMRRVAGYMFGFMSQKAPKGGLVVEASPPPVVVVMGVAGVGKTTVARLLAQRLGALYAEADDFHPQANIAKMSAGIPLNDEDRWPWLERIAEWMSERGREGTGGVVTCSALKRSYRDVLRAGYPEAFFVHLAGSRALIGDRMSHRAGHFMPTTLLDSQFEILEPLQPGERGAVLNVGHSPDELADEALAVVTAGNHASPAPGA